MISGAAQVGQGVLENNDKNRRVHMAAPMFMPSPLDNPVAPTANKYRKWRSSIYPSFQSTKLMNQSYIYIMADCCHNK